MVHLVQRSASRSWDGLLVFCFFAHASEARTGNVNVGLQIQDDFQSWVTRPGLGRGLGSDVWGLSAGEAQTGSETAPRLPTGFGGDAGGGLGAGWSGVGIGGKCGKSVLLTHRTFSSRRKSCCGLVQTAQGGGLA